MKALCSLGDGAPVVGQGLCGRHYARMRKYGSTELPVRKGPPGWGHGKPGEGKYWTPSRVKSALKRYAASNPGPLPTSDHVWNAIKKGRMELPTSASILDLWGTMRFAWLAIGADPTRVKALGTRWSKAEKRFLLDHAGTYTLEQLARRLGRTYASVRTMLGAKGFGIKARENQGYMSALVVAKEYGCSYNRLLQLLNDGAVKGTYSLKLHRWLIDPADAEGAKSLLTAPKRTHVTTPPDIGNYREKYGIRRLAVHKGLPVSPPNDPYASQDNGHSFAGLYGLANPAVSWLIGRGQGELVALTPAELHEAAVEPTCPRRGCKEPMRWRGQEWVCYMHAKPVRLRIPPRLQELPAFPGGLTALLAVADKTVELLYRREDGRTGWRYYVDGEIVRV